MHSSTLRFLPCVLLGALSAAPAGAQTRPLRFGWELPARATVTVHELRQGHRTVLRFRLAAHKAEQNELRLEFSDVQVLSVDDTDLTRAELRDASQRASLERALQYPPLRVSALGGFLGVGDWGPYQQRLLVALRGAAPVQGVPSSEQLEQTARSTEFRQDVASLRQVDWNVWTGAWLDVALAPGESTHDGLELPVGGTPVEAKRTVTCAQAAGGALRLDLEIRLEGPEATQALSKALQAQDPGSSASDYSMISHVDVVTDPRTLMPQTVEREVITRATIRGKPLKTVERESYSFAWEERQHPAASPPLPAAREVAPGVLCQEVELDRDGEPMTVWIYRPQDAQGRLPCVLIAPAGTHLVDGMWLAEGDRPEHLPYVQAGFAVVAYSVDGPLSPDSDSDDWVRAIRRFMEADAGRANARAALDYALSKAADLIDPERIYAVGHSSAAELALQVAEADARIKRVVSYAPRGDLVAALEPKWIARIERRLPGFADWVEQVCPLRQAAKLHAPTLLFYARDDQTISLEKGHELADALRDNGCEVTWAEVATGGHYQSMIDEGIPRGIEFLRQDR